MHVGILPMRYSMGMYHVSALSLLLFAWPSSMLHD
jgi:hypothetical protein